MKLSAFIVAASAAIAIGQEVTLYALYKVHTTSKHPSNMLLVIRRLAPSSAQPPAVFTAPVTPSHPISSSVAPTLLASQEDAATTSLDSHHLAPTQLAATPQPPRMASPPARRSKCYKLYRALLTPDMYIAASCMVARATLGQTSAFQGVFHMTRPLCLLSLRPALRLPLAPLLPQHPLP